MNRPYTAQSPYSLTPTERIRGSRGGRRYGRGRDAHGYGHGQGDMDTDVLTPYPGDDREYDPDGYGPDNYDLDGYDPEYDRDGYDPEYGPDSYDPDKYDPEYDEARIDRRWMWIAGVAGAVLFISVIIASLILGGGDSGSVSATIVSTEASAAPTPSAAAQPSAPRGAAPPTMPSLPAETVTTVTRAPSPTAQPPEAQPLLPAPQAAPPPAAVPGTVTYRITGERRLIDLVTVIYTDQQGALVTDLNVALPWTKTVVLDPGVTLSSVTATSVAGQLNCSITDANGTLIASQNNNSMITNCTR
ncbi:MAG: hypothetical protein ACPHCN_10940 [Mycobacterium sp.]